MNHDTKFYLFVCCWHNNWILLEKPKTVMLIEGSDFDKVMSKIEKANGKVPAIKSFASRAAAVNEFENNKGYAGAELKEMSFGEATHSTEETVSTLPAVIPTTNSVIPPTKEVLAEKDSSWESTKNKDAAWEKDGVDGMKRMCAWYDSSNPDDKNSYKFPHHEYADGQYKTNWNGVKASMGALLGGSILIPEDQRQGVYDHLVPHYIEFNEQPPEFRK